MIPSFKNKRTLGTSRRGRKPTSALSRARLRSDPRLHTSPVISERWYDASKSSRTTRARAKSHFGAEARLAPEVGLEPTTTRLTVACSNIELLRICHLRDAETTAERFLGKLIFRGDGSPHFFTARCGTPRSTRAPLRPRDRTPPSDRSTGSRAPCGTR